ncbi:MAG: nanoRNase/pAp phosphatase (c-di-AMP/oligoRNAs hydrolase) [Halobacteriales archaeon]|jgi:nanoRNase/pAp phosphatase (c-di-AMP/oligoRNAs hydrolase)
MDRVVASLRSSVVTWTDDVFGGLDPVVIATVVVGTIVLLVVIGALYRHWRRPKGVRFRQALAGAEEVSVLMHPNPDPDAMATAMAVQHLAELVETTATVQYSGQIRHQENRAFRTVLNLDLDRIESKEDLAADRVVLVDHNEPRGFAGAERIDPCAVIDHHPGEGTGSAFTDVRPEYGACASIIAEYVEELGIPVDASEASGGNSVGDSLPSDIATGLVYGIRTDTKELTLGITPMDFAAAGFLYPGVDQDQLERIANPQVPEAVLRLKARAIQEKEVRGSFAVCDLGEIDNIDAISQAADELMHLEGVTAVVVYGETDGTVHLSGRSRDDRVHMGQTIENVVDDISMSEGGGHARMGGGQISVDHLEGIGPSEGISREELTDQIFAAMAGER